MNHDHSYGVSTTPNWLSLPIYTNTNVPPNTAYGIGEEIYNTMMKYPVKNPEAYKSKEKTMSVAEKVRRERADAKERQRVERLYTAYDEFDLDNYSSGTVIRFDVELGGGAFKTYVALLIHDEGGKWFVTGREAPNGAPTEDFVAWLIERKVEPNDILILVEERE